MLVSRESHAVWHEIGGSAANAGVQFTEIGARGVFDAADVRRARASRAATSIYPPTTLVEVENTHNRSGGIVVPQASVERVCAAAREHGLATFLDGARLWNAAIASGAHGGGARRAVRPGRGVAVEGPRRAGRIAARRPARTLDLAASATGACSAARCGSPASTPPPACTRSTTTTRASPTTTRTRARFAERLAQSPRVAIDLATVQTNIVVFGLADDAPDGAAVVAAARAKGVLVFAFGPRTIRAVTHLDVSRAQCDEAAATLAAIIDGG